MNDSKRPGRPRDESVDLRVFDAALELLPEVGLGGLTIEGIACRAGVSKATIYRRWDSKEQLLVDVVASIVDAVDFPSSGDIRKDLVTAVSRMTIFITDSRAGEVFPWLVGEIAAQSTIGLRYASAVILPRRQMIAELIASAVERGDLRADLDVETAVDMIAGPVIMRRLAGMLSDSPDTWPETLVDSLLSGWVVT